MESVGFGARASNAVGVSGAVEVSEDAAPPEDAMCAIVADRPACTLPIVVSHCEFGAARLRRLDTPCHSKPTMTPPQDDDVDAGSIRDVASEPSVGRAGPGNPGNRTGSQPAISIPGPVASSSTSGSQPALAVPPAAPARERGVRDTGRLEAVKEAMKEAIRDGISARESQREQRDATRDSVRDLGRDLARSEGTRNEAPRSEPSRSEGRADAPRSDARQAQPERDSLRDVTDSMTESIRQRLETLMPELVRKTLSAGMGAMAQTEDSLRRVAREVNIPSMAGYLASSADATKDRVLEVIARETREFLQHINLTEEVAKLLTTLSLEVKTEIRFIPNSERYMGAEPDVKASVRVKRATESRDDGKGERVAEKIEDERSEGRSRLRFWKRGEGDADE